MAILPIHVFQMELTVHHLTDDKGLDSDFGGQDLSVLQLDTMHPVDTTLCHC
jgi:hypothetical protein